METEQKIIAAMLANDDAMMKLWFIKDEMTPQQFGKCKSNLHENAIIIWDVYMDNHVVEV